jgi:hypothetical protein
LKPAAKGLRMHGIFVGGKGRKHMVADSALKPVQVYARAFRLDADEHHRSFAPRTGGALKCNRVNGGQRALRLGHDHTPYARRERNTLSHREMPGCGTVIAQVCAAATSNASQFGSRHPYGTGTASGWQNHRLRKAAEQSRKNTPPGLKCPVPAALVSNWGSEIPT